MFSRLRSRFGVPGVISVIALVFAMFGGAYAASNGRDGGEATASAKAKQGPKGPRGARGPVGPVGPAGPQGPKGDTGAAGANGKDGANGSAGAAGGKGATGATGATGVEGEIGSNGAKGATGATGVTGTTGSPWTAGGTLPSGATETGSWALGTVAAGAVPPPGAVGLALPVSFPIKLAAGLDAAHVHFIGKNGKEQIIGPISEEPEEVTPTDCLGTAVAPTAAAGHFCVYTGLLEKAFLFSSQIDNPAVGGVSPGASTTGAYLNAVGVATGAKGNGTWAVTAP